MKKLVLVIFLAFLLGFGMNVKEVNAYRVHLTQRENEIEKAVIKSQEKKNDKWMNEYALPDKTLKLNVLNKNLKYDVKVHPSAMYDKKYDEKLKMHYLHFPVVVTVTDGKKVLEAYQGAYNIFLKKSDGEVYIHSVKSRFSYDDKFKKIEDLDSLTDSYKKKINKYLNKKYGEMAEKILLKTYDEWNVYPEESIKLGEKYSYKSRYAQKKNDDDFFQLEGNFGITVNSSKNITEKEARKLGYTGHKLEENWNFKLVNITWEAKGLKIINSNVKVYKKDILPFFAGTDIFEGVVYGMRNELGCYKSLQETMNKKFKNQEVDKDTNIKIDVNLILLAYEESGDAKATFCIPKDFNHEYKRIYFDIQ